MSSRRWPHLMAAPFLVQMYWDQGEKRLLSGDWSVRTLINCYTQKNRCSHLIRKGKKPKKQVKTPLKKKVNFRLSGQINNWEILFVTLNQPGIDHIRIERDYHLQTGNAVLWSEFKFPQTPLGNANTHIGTIPSGLHRSTCACFQNQAQIQITWSEHTPRQVSSNENTTGTSRLIRIWTI